MGGNELVSMIERFLQVKLGQTTADGAITVEAVYCLGNCALSPAVMVDGKLVGRVDPAKFEKIVAECRA
jgi:formate dehydrogenase subunit gamma